MIANRKNGEVSDVPFFGNDMEAGPPTTDKPLDTSDGPGKADAEIAEDPERLPLEPATRPVDPDDALIQEPRDNAFTER